MSFTSWFNTTRKVSKVLPKEKLALPTTRKFEAPESAMTRILGHFKNPTPGQRSGRDALRKGIVGPARANWHRPHLRTIPGLWYYKSPEERYQLAKNSFFRTKGRIAPKKGAGKKALKRMADAKKAAAKAKK